MENDGWAWQAPGISSGSAGEEGAARWVPGIVTCDAREAPGEDIDTLSLLSPAFALAMRSVRATSTCDLASAPVRRFTDFATPAVAGGMQVKTIHSATTMPTEDHLPSLGSRRPRRNSSGLAPACEGVNSNRYVTNSPGRTKVVFLGNPNDAFSYLPAVHDAGIAFGCAQSGSSASALRGPCDLPDDLTAMGRNAGQGRERRYSPAFSLQACWHNIFSLGRLAQASSSRAKCAVP